MDNNDLVFDTKNMIKDYIPLFPDPAYQYSVSIGGMSKIIKMEYRTIDKAFRLSVYNPDNSPVVVGVKVVPLFPMLADYDLTDHGLNGYFYLEPISILGDKEIVIEDYETLFEKYRLCYFYPEEL